MIVPQNLLGGRPASKHRHIDRLCGNKHATPIASFSLLTPSQNWIPCIFPHVTKVTLTILVVDELTIIIISKTTTKANK